MDNYERQNRIAEALKIRNLKQVELVEKTGLSKSAINNWIAQRWQPKDKSLAIMARALNVSEMWLAGYDVPMERPAEQVAMDELAQFIQIIRKNEDIKRLCINIAKLDKEQIVIIENLVNELGKVNPR